MTPETFERIAVGVLGLALGSFLNVVVHRLPRGESLVRPRSRCPACGTPIPWYRNLPVVSWIALGGRCAACRAPIALRYPAVELVSALVLLLVHARFGMGTTFAVFAPFALAMVALFAIDLEHQLLPDAITLPGTALGLVTAVAGLNPAVRWYESLIGAALGFGVLWVLAEAYQRVRQEEGMGGGDLKLAAMIGAFTGPKGLVAVLLVASLAGVAVGFSLVLLRRAGMRSALPFGCFLAPAALLVALLGPDLMWIAWRNFLLETIYGIPPPR